MNSPSLTCREVCHVPGCDVDSPVHCIDVAVDLRLVVVVVVVMLCHDGHSNSELDACLATTLVWELHVSAGAIDAVEVRARSIPKTMSIAPAMMIMPTNVKPTLFEARFAQKLLTSTSFCTCFQSERLCLRRTDFCVCVFEI
jgi:hypothetical protein